MTPQSDRVLEHPQIDRAREYINKLKFAAAADCLRAVARELSKMANDDWGLIISDHLAELSIRLREQDKVQVKRCKLRERYEGMKKAWETIDRHLEEVFGYFEKLEDITVPFLERAHLASRTDFRGALLEDIFLYLRMVYRKYLSGEAVKDTTWDQFLSDLARQIRFYSRLPKFGTPSHRVLGRKSWVQKGLYVEFLDLMDKAEYYHGLIKETESILKSIKKPNETYEEAHWARVEECEQVYLLSEELELLVKGDTKPREPLPGGVVSAGRSYGPLNYCSGVILTGRHL